MFDWFSANEIDKINEVDKLIALINSLINGSTKTDWEFDCFLAIVVDWKREFSSFLLLLLLKSLFKFVLNVFEIMSFINEKYVIIASLIISISSWWIFLFSLIALRISKFKFLNFNITWLLNWRRSLKLLTKNFCKR